MKQHIIDAVADFIVSTIDGMSDNTEGWQAYQASRSKTPDFTDIIPKEKVAAVVIDSNRKQSVNCGMEDWASQILLEVYAMPNSSDEKAIDSRLTYYAAEIMVELSKDITCGGLAYELEINDFDLLYTGDEFACVDITVTIKYEHPKGNPFIDTGA